MDKNYSTTKLCYKLLDDSYLDENGRIKEENKFNINNPTFNIQNSKFIGKPEDKFETMLFLPEGEGRQGEGGLRTKGYFKFSYVKRERLDVRGETSDSLLYNDIWYIADFNGNPVTPASEHIQQQIQSYISRLTSHVSPITSLPLITVITVVYNGAKYLEKTIQSVINQTYPNVEYIIIDGGSTDGTLDIIKKYEDYIDYWVSEKDKGIYDAMNKGVQVSTGMWLNMLNCGDVYNDNFVIAKIFNKQYERSVFAIAGKWLIEYHGKAFVYSPDPYRMLKKPGWYINHQAFFYKILTHKKLGMYSNEYKICGDDDFYFRILTNNFKITTSDILMVKYSLNDNTSNTFKQIFEHYKIRNKYIGFSINGLLYFLLNIGKRIIRKTLEYLGLKNIVVFYRNLHLNLKK
jgi:glycosyltransferase involved in cell wall biosynthesis